jgi:protein phosphatase
VSALLNRYLLLPMPSSPSTRYLWAADPQAAWIPTDKLVENRYHVKSPQLWLDTKSGERPEALWPLPDRARPYARLSRYRLHLPQLYGFCSLGRSGKKSVDIPLLDNIPIDSEGELMPALTEVWPQANALQQAHWLWQMVDLWTPLADIGVGYSLLVGKNLRVQDWRLRLCELLPDSLNPAGRSTAIGLANFWQTLSETARPEIVEVLQPLIDKMQIGKLAVADGAALINQCLLEQAARLPLTVTMAGGSDSGNQNHNEDSFYPGPGDLDAMAGLGIICDGVAGHEGGEVASQMAVQSLQLQLRAFVAEVSRETRPISSGQAIDHLQLVLRVANNLIATQNDNQSREGRRRMATTLVAALQLPQLVVTEYGAGTSHEIYVASVGDSRAYWITRNSCQLLTVDDDVAQREVSQGKSMPWQAQGRIDAGSLTQALGIRSGEALQPLVQRLMAIEDGVMLLCSDGLSDRRLVEKSWMDYVPKILNGRLPLANAVEDWLERGRVENGHDNLSLVLMHCRVTPESMDFNPEEDLPPVARSRRPKIWRWLPLSLLMGGLGIAGFAGYYIWFQAKFRSTPPQISPTIPAAPIDGSVPTVPAVPAP